LQDKNKIFFNSLWINTQDEDLEFIFEYLTSIFYSLTNTEPLYKLEDLKDERNLLEVTIETLTAIYCIYSNSDYDTVDYVKIMKEVKLMDYLINLKMEKFGKEILGDLNLKIFEKVDNGYIILDKNIYN
jgi:hypothetical protein